MQLQRKCVAYFYINAREINPKYKYIAHCKTWDDSIALCFDNTQHILLKYTRCYCNFATQDLDSRKLSSFKKLISPFLNSRLQK